MDDATNGFSLVVKPAQKWREAIKALLNNEFNPEGFGRVDVDEESFQITVWNLSSGVVGCLCLSDNQSYNYRCSKPIEAKKIDLNHVFFGLFVAAINDDTITISSVDGSDQLCFTFGNDPDIMFSTDLMELDAPIDKFPVVINRIGVRMETPVFREIIQVMIENSIPQRVQVNITDSNVIITVGDVNEWRNATLMADGMTLATLHQEYNRWFQLPHTESLLIASYIGSHLSLHFLDTPTNALMLQFFNGEFWDLTYIKLQNSPVLTFQLLQTPQNLRAIIPPQDTKGTCSDVDDYDEFIPTDLVIQMIPLFIQLCQEGNDDVTGSSTKLIKVIADGATIEKFAVINSACSAIMQTQILRAGQSAADQKRTKKPCRYFFSGGCNKSEDACIFSHVPTDRLPAKSNNMCWYYHEKGNCKLVERCGFKH